MTIRDHQTPAGRASDAAVPDPAAGFDDLLAASSLGAAHVQAFMEPLPDAVAQRFASRLGRETADGDSAGTDAKPAPKAEYGAHQPPAPFENTAATGSAWRMPPTTAASHRRNPAVFEAGHSRVEQAILAVLRDFPDYRSKDVEPAFHSQQQTLFPTLLTLLAMRAGRRGDKLASALYDTAPKPQPVSESAWLTAPDNAAADCKISIQELLHDWWGWAHPKGAHFGRLPFTSMHTYLVGAGGSGKSIPAERMAAKLRCENDLWHEPGGGARQPILMFVSYGLGTGKTTSMQRLFDMPRPTDPCGLAKEVLHTLAKATARKGDIDTYARLVERLLRTGTRKTSRIDAWLAAVDRTSATRAPNEERCPVWWAHDLAFLQSACYTGTDHVVSRRSDLHATRWEGERWPRPAVWDLGRCPQDSAMLLFRLAAHEGRDAAGTAEASPQPQPAEPALPPGSELLLHTDGMLDGDTSSLEQQLRILLNDGCHSAAPNPPSVPSEAGQTHRTTSQVRQGASPGLGRYRADTVKLTANPRLGMETVTTDGATVLRAQVRMSLLAPGKQDIGVPTEFLYDSHDPYAVVMTLTPDGQSPVTWTFSRDLLAEGLTHPAGTGDVRIWSDPAGLATSNSSDRCVHISLDAPDGHAHLTAPRQDIEAFVAATRKIVPPGREHTQLADDAFDALTTGVQPTTSGA